MAIWQVPSPPAASFVVDNRWHATEKGCAFRGPVRATVRLGRVTQALRLPTATPSPSPHTCRWVNGKKGYLSLSPAIWQRGVCARQVKEVVIDEACARGRHVLETTNL